MVQISERRPGDPERLGPWEIKGRIGAGGMGVVYQGTSNGRSAAVKMVRPGLLDDPATQARFAREVEVLRRVRDVHISEFIDADVLGEPAWLATALIDGPNLKDEVDEHGPLADDRWWELAHGLAQALAVLEVHGVIHRDVKPSNVILSPAGPVLIDFGIANPEDAASLTSTGLVTGSPAWLSPEQADQGTMTAASDVFSLGSLLAYAATGRPPFGQGAQIATLLAIATRQPDLRGCSPEQHGLLAALLQKDPAARPSARQVLSWTKNQGAGSTGSDGNVGADPTVVLGTSTAAAILAAGGATGAASAGQPGADPTTVLPAPGRSADQTAVTPARVRPAAAPPAAAPPAAPPTAAPARKGGARWLWILLLVFILAGGGWLLFGRGGSGPDPGADPTATATPTPTGPAPTADVLRSGDWLLSSYRIGNDGGILSVSATLQNQGDAPASGPVSVEVYADGEYVGTVTGEVSNVPAGGQVEVELTSDAEWKAGDPTLVLSVP